MATSIGAFSLHLVSSKRKEPKSNYKLRIPQPHRERWPAARKAFAALQQNKKKVFTARNYRSKVGEENSNGTRGGRCGSASRVKGSADECVLFCTDPTERCAYAVARSGRERTFFSSRPDRVRSRHTSRGDRSAPASNGTDVLRFASEPGDHLAEAPAQIGERPAIRVVAGQHGGLVAAAVQHVHRLQLGPFISTARR